MRPNTGDRKSLVDDGRWLSLDRRGSTKSQVKQTSGSVTSAAVSAETKNKTSQVKRSVSRAKSREKSRSPSLPREKSRSPSSLPREKSRSPSRGKSQDASDQEERDARSFWVSMDSSQAQAEEIRKSSSMSMSRKTSGKQSFKKTSGASADRKISDEPPVDYDQEDAKKSKHSSKIKRGSQVTKRQMESSTSNAVSESAFSSAEQQRYNMNTVNSEDYDRGTNYPMVKHSTGARQDSNGDTLKRNSTSLSRRGTIIDSNINRDGFGRDNEHSNAVAIRSRNGSNANDSKHFLSLQLFNKVNVLIYRGISLTCKCSF